MTSIFYEDAAKFGDPVALGETTLKTNYMNIDLTITEEKKISKEIELPYYSHDICYFLMIATNETIISVKPGTADLSSEIEILTPGAICYKNSLIQAINGKVISESDFFAQYNKVKEKIFEAVETSMEKERNNFDQRASTLKNRLNPTL